MPRLFVAIRPPAAVRNQLLTMMGGVEGARWQDDEQLHVTLRFIGEVDGRTARDISDALAGVRARRFEIALAGVGMFDRRGRMETLWAGVQPREPVAALHKKIDGACVRAGLAPERRAYRPHITLARFSRGGDADAFLVKHGGLTSAPFPVTHFALMESHLAGEGARYEIVERWPLDGASARC